MRAARGLDGAHHGGLNLRPVRYRVQACLSALTRQPSLSLESAVSTLNGSPLLRGT